MWKEGVIGIPDGSGGYIKCRYWVKVYDTPSAEYGIDGGRISKLTIRIDGEVTANFDRGWDKKPTNDATCKALQILLHDYN